METLNEINETFKIISPKSATSATFAAHTTDLMFAACDEKYFEAYGPSFIQSANKFDLIPWIHIVNYHKTGQAKKIVDRIHAGKKCILSKHYSPSIEEHKLINQNDDRLRTYYASLRFFIAPILFEHLVNYKDRFNPKIHISDIDQVIRNRPVFPQCDLGLYFRHHEPVGMQVAAGLVTVNNRSKHILDNIISIIISLPAQWFVDQFAIYNSYHTQQYISQSTRSELVVYNYNNLNTPKMLDWEFNDDSYIWTGKGPRKHDNEKYVNYVNKLTEEFWND